MSNNNPTWKELPYSNSDDRSYHTSTLFKNYIITYGGFSQNLKSYLGIKLLNLNKGSFEDFNLQGEKPLYRNKHSACLLDSNKILIFGGYDGKKVLDDAAIITIKETLPLTLNYQKITTTRGDKIFRSHHSADIYQNKMYVFGGRQIYKPVTNNNELWSFDLESFTWEICQPTGDKPEPRVLHCSAIYKNKLYIFGGYSDSNTVSLNSCSVLSLKKMQWKSLEIKGMDFLKRYGTSSIIYKDTLTIIGGCYDNKNQVLTYSFEESILRSSDYQGDYIPVIGGTAIAYKDNLILWGGFKNQEDSISKLTCLQFGETRLDCMYEGQNDRFSNHIGSLFNPEDFSDVRFSIEDHEIPAHKVLLATRCKYFSNLFKSGMKESNSSIIQVKNVKLDTFKALLQFLYQNITELTVPLALDLYGVADEYMQIELVGICENFLSKNITLDNLMSIVDIVQKFEAKELKNSVLEFMIDNFEALKESQVCYLLPYSYTIEVVSRLQNKLQLQKKP